MPFWKNLERILRGGGLYIYESLTSTKAARTLIDLRPPGLMSKNFYGPQRKTEEWGRLKALYSYYLEGDTKTFRGL